MPRIAAMKSLIVKQSVVVDGHKTSVSIEPAFWNEIKRIARTAGITTRQYVTLIDRHRAAGNLSSCLRLAVLADLKGMVVSLGSKALQAAE